MSHDPREILGYARTLAVVGASRDPGKPSGTIPHLLQHRGYHIIPVNPTAKELFGVPASASLLDIKEPVDAVDVFRPAAEAPGIARLSSSRSYGCAPRLATRSLAPTAWPAGPAAPTGLYPILALRPTRTCRP